ncbi:MAG TPA: copper chaperone PCu(A)C [Devosiaceae bacterium]|jgi:hypothetical protein
MKIRFLSAALLALSLFAIPALAQDAPAVVTAGSLEISGAFTRATLPNAPVAGGYFTIVNKGAEDDTLVSVTTPAAGTSQLHEMSMQGDVMKMAALPDGIPVPAGQTVTLKPDGLHIMFMQLTQAFVEGTNVPVTLTFAKAGTVTVNLAVGSVGAKAPNMAGMKM